MPAGELYCREIRSSETPEDLHRRVVLQLSPLLAPAHYKLAAEDPQHIEYSRRYLPTAALIAALLALVLAAAAALADVPAPAAALGLAGLVTLLFARRSEELRVAVQPRPGGSTAYLSGFLTSRARMSLLGFEPPRGRKLVPAVHGESDQRQPRRPSAG